MAERRKIIIQTGAEPGEPLPTPHFDAEATLTARPVVPLTDQEAQQIHYGNYAGRAGAKPFWKRPALLALIVLAAVGVGIAAGLAIGVYRNRQTAETPVATTPSSTVEEAEVNQTVEQPQPTPPTEQAKAAVPDEPEEETPAEPKVEERERTVRNERKDDDNNDARPPVVVKPPVVREKKPVKIDEYVIEDGRGEARRAENEQRREERRAERRDRRRRGREDDINIPRGIERGRREVDRIREIFEGRQP